MVFEEIFFVVVERENIFCCCSKRKKEEKMSDNEEYFIGIEQKPTDRARRKAQIRVWSIQRHPNRKTFASLSTYTRGFLLLNI